MRKILQKISIWLFRWAYGLSDNKYNIKKGE